MSFLKPSIPWTALNGSSSREGTVAQWLNRRCGVRLNCRDRDGEVSTAPSGVARDARDRPREARFGFCRSPVVRAGRACPHARPREGEVTQRRSGGDRARERGWAALNGRGRGGIVRGRVERCSPHDGSVAVRRNRRERAVKGHGRVGTGVVRCSGRGIQNTEARQLLVAKDGGIGLAFCASLGSSRGRAGVEVAEGEESTGRREIPWHGGPLCHPVPNRPLLPTQPRYARPGSRPAGR